MAAGIINRDYIESPKFYIWIVDYIYSDQFRSIRDIFLS